MKKATIRNVLVPIDFSQLSIEAGKTAQRLARRFGASIHLAHVCHFNYAADFVVPAPPIVPFSFMPYNRDGEEGILRELQRLARECGISSARGHVLTGAPPFDEICRLAQTIPADLIVMPTHGRTGLKHVFLGSTAERIVQHSSCPVFVTRGNVVPSSKALRFRMKKILVPVDFSDCSREGLQFAIRFGREFGAKIILLHATYLGYVYASEGNAIYDVRALQDSALKNAVHRMRDLVHGINFGGVKFDTVLTEGSPVLDICAFAKDHDVDLIVTSTHGFTGFKHVLIGSIAEQVVRHAPCSVLVVPSHPHIRAANLTTSNVAKAKTPANSPRRIRSEADQRQSRESPGDRMLNRKDRNPAAHAFPERRKTNKFREPHSGR